MSTAQTPPSRTPDLLLRRREAVTAATAAALGLVVAGCGNDGSTSAASAATVGAGESAEATAAAAAQCVLAPELTEGPYYLDLDLTRRDIRENRPGTLLSMSFVVVDATTCKPIPNATVEIWHADAGGTYSGVQGNSGKFLRGGQKTDSNGRVRFTTIFPGWYQGRTPHVHIKVFAGGEEVHTGQVFFTDSAQRSIYRRGVYAARGQADTTNASDGIFAQGGDRAIMKLTRRDSKKISAGYRGTMTIGVDRG